MTVANGGGGATGERLQKSLARAGLASRRSAEKWILDGRVEVNGKVVATLGTRVDPQRDVIRVDGKRVGQPPETAVWVLLHKPRGVMTTLSDPERRPTVRDLLPDLRRRVFPVGRLDFNTEGLLLLTDDGALARDLMHPSHGVVKTYHAKVRGTPDGSVLDRLRRGILIDGKRTRPAEIRIVRPAANSWIEIRVTEGRKHQVRKMLEAVGHPVSRLRRVGYAGLRLGRLAPGEWRYLRPEEVESLRRAARPQIGLQTRRAGASSPA